MTKDTVTTTKHKRFDRMVWVFRDDFTSALAKCLVSQSPYPVPDNLERILTDFYNRVPYDFDENGMAKVSLKTMTCCINEVLEKMPDVMALNERKNGNKRIGISCRFSDPDDDFIDIMAVAQNMTCVFAEREDAQCWLDSQQLA